MSNRSGAGTQNMADKPIFFDATGRRANIVSVIGWGAAIISTVLGVFFIVSLFMTPHVANLNLPGRLTAIHTPELEKSAPRRACCGPPHGWPQRCAPNAPILRKCGVSARTAGA